MENKILVFSCGYNCVDFVKSHLNSVYMQDYDNFIHCIVDDCSTDGTYEILKEWRSRYDRPISLYQLKEHVGSVSYSFATGLYPDDNDIVVLLDLDDCFYDPFVLSYINKIYNETNCWLTHGSFVRLSNNTIQGEPYPEEIKNNRDYRKHPRWLAQHLRTFRGFLWNNFDKDDLKGEEGEWPVSVNDMAMMFPMLEMCPPDKVKFIESVLYLYNDLNPLNEFRVNKHTIKKNEALVRNKPKYKELVR